MDKRLTAGIAIVITALYVVSTAVAMFSRDYAPPASLHLLMTVVAGSAFGATAFQKAKEVAEKVERLSTPDADDAR